MDVRNEKGVVYNEEEWKVRHIVYNFWTHAIHFLTSLTYPMPKYDT